MVCLFLGEKGKLLFYILLKRLPVTILNCRFYESNE